MSSVFGRPDYFGLMQKMRGTCYMWFRLFAYTSLLQHGNGCHADDSSIANLIFALGVQCIGRMKYYECLATDRYGP